MAPEPAPAWRAVPGGLLLSVRLTPKAARDAVDGFGLLADGRAVLLARVRAVPAKGAANAALERLLAKALRLPAGAVSVEGGRTARLKSVRLLGEPATLAAALDALTGIDDAADTP